MTKSVVCALTGIALRDGVLPGTAASIAPYLAAVDTLDSADSAYFAWGYGGQFVYVVPDRDLVVVATTDWLQLTEITPTELAAQVLGVIGNHVVPAAQ